jgi:integrase
MDPNLDPRVFRVKLQGSRTPMKINITSSFAHAVKPPAIGQIDYPDEKTSGFGLRVSMGGTKTWIVRYRKNGYRHRYVIGRFPQVSVADARQTARRYLGEVAAGNDPAQERADAKAEPKFAGLAQLYLERHAMVHKAPKSVVEDRKMLNSDILPLWKNLKLSAISRRDVIALLDTAVARNAPIKANRLKALLSKVFSFALARELVEYNPVLGVPRPAPEHSRERVLSEDELRRLWIALGAEPAHIAATFKLLLLTAARRSEVLGMKWSEIDLDTELWTLPAERSKNRNQHRIPLTPGATEVLRSLKERNGTSDCVFEGGRIGRPIANPQRWLARLRTHAGLEDFRLHDLRRSVASHITALGVPRLVVTKLLNHAETGITSVYDRHSYDPEKRAALLKWERRLTEVVEGVQAPAKVVSIRAGAAS